MDSGHLIISLHLGGVAGPSGLAVIEPWSVYWHPGGREDELEWENHYDIIWLERLAAGRALPAIVARIQELGAEKRLARGYTLIMDTTASGAAPARVFEQHALYPSMIELTNARAMAYQDGVTRVPLADAITTAQAVVQTSRFRVAEALDLAPDLIVDLQGFDVAPVTRSWDARGGRNNDLVFSVAVGLWCGEKLRWNEDKIAAMLPKVLPPSDTDRSPVTGY